MRASVLPLERPADGLRTPPKACPGEFGLRKTGERGAGQRSNHLVARLWESRNRH
jgi:hypothetical protein